MRSLTKVELSADQLRLAVRAAFADTVTLVRWEEFQDGWFNTIYGLELSDGRSLALKLAPKAGVPVLRYETDLLSTEVAVYRLLAEVEGVRVPRLWFHEATGSVLGLPWFLMDRIGFPTYAKGKEAMAPADRQTVERNLGAMNRRLNSVVGPAFGSLNPGGRRCARWSDEVAALVEDVLADGRDAGSRLPWADGRILGLFRRCRDTLDQVTEPRLIHWDLHDGNVFVEGTEVRALIDGDRARWGDPLMEVYFSTLLGPEHFTAGYGPGVAGAPGADLRRALYDVYLGLVMRVECDFRGFEEGHRTWTDGNLAAALDRCAALAGV